MPAFRDEEEEDTLYDDVERMADRMGLKGEKRRTYIHDHMTQAGYEAVQTRESYRPVRREEEETEEQGGSRWFGSPDRDTRRTRSSRSSRDEDDRF